MGDPKQNRPDDQGVRPSQGAPSRPEFQHLTSHGQRQGEKPVLPPEIKSSCCITSGGPISAAIDVSCRKRAKTTKGGRSLPDHNETDLSREQEEPVKNSRNVTVPTRRQTICRDAFATHQAVLSLFTDNSGLAT
jgi:hypothetical protein